MDSSRIEVWTGIGVPQDHYRGLLDHTSLLPQDKEFLARHPQCKTPLRQLRLIEEHLLAGRPVPVFSDQIPPSDILDANLNTRHVSANSLPRIMEQTVGAILKSADPAEVDAAVPLILTQMSGVLVKTAAPESKTYRPRDVEIVQAYLTPCLQADQVTVQASTRPFFFSSHPYAQPLAHHIRYFRDLNPFTHPPASMRVERQVITAKQLTYYGVTIDLPTSPEGNFTASELELGLLTIQDDKGDTLGVVDARPQLIPQSVTRVTRDLISPQKIFAYLNLTEPAGFRESAPAFFQSCHEIFSDDHTRPGSLWRLGDTTPDFSDHKRLKNINALSVGEKFTLWRMLTQAQPEIQTAARKLLQKCGVEAATLFYALADEPETLIKLSQEATFPLDLPAAVRYLAQSQLQTREYLRDATSIAVNRGSDLAPALINEYPAHIEARFRQIMYEAVISLLAYSQKQIKPRSDTQRERDALHYHTAAAAGIAEIMKYFYEDATGLAHMPVQFTAQALENLQEMSARLPHSHETYHTIMTLWFVRALRNQQQMYGAKNTQELVNTRQKWLDEFYDRVIHRFQIYEKAEAYADIGDLEPKRQASLIIDLIDSGHLPEDFADIKLAVGDGFRVDAKTHTRLAAYQQKHPEKKYLPREIVGIDMVASPNRWPVMEFYQSRVEELLGNHPEFRRRFNLVEMNGSPWNPFQNSAAFEDRVL